MHSTVSSDWLPSYIKATQPVLKIFKMAGYFPDSPLTYVTKLCPLLPAYVLSKQLLKRLTGFQDKWYKHCYPAPQATDQFPAITNRRRQY